MGLMPGTSITATDTKPQYPTSAATIATGYLTSATIDITLTQVQTASFASHPNTVSLDSPRYTKLMTNKSKAAAASMPTDDMAKFLARWKD